MPWTVILSNNEVIKQNELDIGHWRSLSQKCRKEGLKIKDLKIEGSSPFNIQKVDSYFIIYDIIVPSLTKPNIQHVKMGVGAIFKNKCYIKWYKISGKPDLNTEIIHEIPESYKELAISRDGHV